ncbi:MAG: efflux RND transporter periplasmic adaptor subunit [Vicinamibacteria bacterium]|jgi:HlyD family secretion protein|nr:efflux RND transporter periplasmic adaptor subunit [Vicinamibacteria bacterium]
MKYRGLLLTLGALGLAAAAWAALRGDKGAVTYATATVARGDVVEVVGATGTLQAVTTVQVGSQVSGTISRLHVDFNDTVRAGQVVAELDPSLFEARLRQAEANLASAKANLDRSRAALDDARQKGNRAEQLWTEQLLPETDLETARANALSAEAQVKSSEAAVRQSEASLNQAQVDRRHTVIQAPIDGVVIGRNVDVGQTVAASLQAPTLFVIANDLRQMQVRAGIDEADVGRVREGMAATFRVDAYPEELFPARVEQVRLQPQVVSNVVTYDTLLSVDNVDQKLKPGMTATVSLEVRRADGVLRVPASALRFRPEGADPAAARRPGAAAATRGAGAGGGPGNGAGRRRAEGRTGAEAGGHGGGRPATLYTLGADGKPAPVEVRLGLSDGQFVEVRSGLDEGAAVITGTASPGTAAVGPAGRASASPTSNPFQPQFQRRQR